MTMRTYVHFICPNGHLGEERTSENDQPFSDMWESVTLTGMRAVKVGQEDRYSCEKCGELMSQTQRPK